ncbi:Dolichyl pyrophosphate phosphatase and related acid phosphatases [Phaffia rhodozyma]|uniref:Dolichyldiphosphatase n=1 Tax=Phaffia rhodozyma TaxID=264483 RepID=A0A0F7SQ45_PHARH|nr:Dolichyl pyrophosphate phosphatase and related acid phosphatases [Phaffia rhodozyma]
MLNSTPSSLAVLELSQVTYNPSDPVSHVLAILTLSPIMVIPAYLVAFVFEREATVLNMLAGQLINEAFSWVLKQNIKAERPYANIGSGNASPSSHAQFFGYLFTFLLVVLTQVQTSPKSWTDEQKTLWWWKRLIVLVGTAIWSFLLCFSRWYLYYHTTSQVYFGFFLGVVFALVWASITEVSPRLSPEGLAGISRRWVVHTLLGSWPLKYLEVGDRWEAGKDGWEKFGGRPGGNGSERKED